MKTLALVHIFAALLNTATQVSASPMRFNALCSASGAFDRCSVEFEKSQMIFVSIDGLHEMNFCTKKTISYRSNPASPYQKISGAEKTIVDTVRRERGIDHDFLIKYKSNNSGDRQTRIIVRFKNQKAAIKFAEKLSQSTESC